MMESQGSELQNTYKTINCTLIINKSLNSAPELKCLYFAAPKTWQNKLIFKDRWDIICSDRTMFYSIYREWPAFVAGKNFFI